MKKGRLSWLGHILLALLLIWGGVSERFGNPGGFLLLREAFHCQNSGKNVFLPLSPDGAGGGDATCCFWGCGCPAMGLGLVLQEQSIDFSVFSCQINNRYFVFGGYRTGHPRPPIRAPPVF